MRTLKEWSSCRRALSLHFTTWPPLMRKYPHRCKQRNVCMGTALGRTASSGAEVILRLQAAVCIVPRCRIRLLRSENSVAETRRVLAMQTGPQVTETHSWGGYLSSETDVTPKF